MTMERLARQALPQGTAGSRSTPGYPVVDPVPSQRMIDGGSGGALGVV